MMHKLHEVFILCDQDGGRASARGGEDCCIVGPKLIYVLNMHDTHVVGRVEPTCEGRRQLRIDPNG